MSDYSEMTTEDFDRLLLAELDGKTACDLLDIPEVWEPVSEYYNNAVLDAWEAERAPFAEFQASKVEAYDRLPDDHGGLLMSALGCDGALLYAGGQGVITYKNEPFGGGRIYTLEIANAIGSGSDLEPLERNLFSYLQAEGVV